MVKLYNPFKAAGFRNLRQVAAKLGKSAGAKALNTKAIGKIASYKKGGRVRRTGLALVHKGEYVIPRHKMRRHRRH
jgi:hypothetical protein